jgi:aerobic carbon-monoxide dehydrogenase small subunit
MNKLIDFFKSLFGKKEQQPTARKPIPSTLPITLTVNGETHKLMVEPQRLLVEVIRDDLGLLGAKRGCEANVCGACTVLLDGKSVHSCCVLAVQADRKSVTTIEGLEEGGELHPVQQAYLDHLGYQCGYCTPGMILSSIVLLEENPDPTPEEVKYGLTGNVCRCTGYVKIVKSVQAAAEVMREMA